MAPATNELSVEAVLSLLSAPTVDAAPFWEACDLGVLRLPRCCACGRFSYFPRLHCPHCGNRELKFEEVDPHGCVHSFAHVEFSPFGDFWAADVPYTVVRVDMPCGVRLMSRLVGRTRAAVRIGDAVLTCFAPVKGSERRIPVFVRDAELGSSA